MSRLLTSLPMVNPTIRRSGETTSASSGSGTLHLLSARTRMGFSGPTTRSGVAFRNSSGRLFFAGDLAPLVGHARGPDFLPVDRGEERLPAERLRRGGDVAQFTG